MMSQILVSFRSSEDASSKSYPVDSEGAATNTSESLAHLRNAIREVQKDTNKALTDIIQASKDETQTSEEKAIEALEEEDDSEEEQEVSEAKKAKTQ